MCEATPDAMQKTKKMLFFPRKIKDGKLQQTDFLEGKRVFETFDLAVRLLQHILVGVYVSAPRPQHHKQQTDRETDRQIDRQTDRQTDRETDRQRDRQTETQPPRSGTQ